MDCRRRPACPTGCALRWAPGTGCSRAFRTPSQRSAILVQSCGRATCHSRSGARSSTDRASDYGSEGWGFESLRARRGLPRSAPVFPADRGPRPAAIPLAVPLTAPPACCCGPGGLRLSVPFGAGAGAGAWRMTSATRGPRGGGTQRERRPGVWEVRIPLGPDPVTGRTRHRSATVHGTSADATRVRTQLRAERADLAGSGSLPPGPLITVGELLGAWLAAGHPWKPSTVVGYRSTVKSLLDDAIADLRVMSLSPRVVRDLVEGWARAGVSPAVAAARVRGAPLRGGLGVGRTDPGGPPGAVHAGPARVPPRRPLRDNEVRALLATAELRVLEAHANHTPADPTLADHAPAGRTPARRGEGRLHRAEQDLLLVRAGRGHRSPPRRARRPPDRGPGRAGAAHRQGRLRRGADHTKVRPRARTHPRRHHRRAVAHLHPGLELSGPATR